LGFLSKEFFNWRLFFCSRRLQPAPAQAGRLCHHFLVPKLGLGTQMGSKLRFEGQAKPDAQAKEGFAGWLGRTTKCRYGLGIKAFWQDPKVGVQGSDDEGNEKQTPLF
jgi:hypothetical protein